MPDPRMQSWLLGAVFATAIVASVLLRRSRTRQLDLFAAFCGSLGLWYSFSLLDQFRPDTGWRRAALAVLVLVPQMAVRFFRAFLGDAPRRSRFVTTVTIVGVAAMALVASPLWNERAAGIGIAVYWWTVMWAALWYLYIRSGRIASRIEAARVRLLVVGGVLALSFSLLDYLPEIGVAFPQLGPILTLLVMYALSQALLRFRLFDLYELFGRFAVMTALALTLAGIFSALVVWAEASHVFFLNAVAAAFVILIVFDPLRTMVEQRIGEILLRERFALEAMARDVRRRLARALSTDEIARTVIGALEENRRFTHGSIYLLAADGLSLARRAYFGPEPASEIEVASARPLLDAIASADSEALSVHDLRREIERPGASAGGPRREAIDNALHIMGDMRADLVVPIRGEARVLGLLALRDERTPEAIPDAEAKLIASIAAQAAVAAENADVYQRMKVRDRLAAVGEMAAGLAHEIRNPLGAIKAAAQILDDRKTVEQAEMVRVLVEETDRLNRVVTDFLDYARPRPKGTQRAGVPAVLERCIAVLKAQAGPSLTVDPVVAGSLPDVPVDAERLQQVFLNLALNAAQAVGNNGRIEITATTRRDSGATAGPRTSQPGLKVLVRFRDYGPGMDAETAGRIFIPFFTTKPGGAGLGLAISQRIVEEAGGAIEVRSEPDRGSDFTVVLPAA
ncbi:MAG: ATP-binding protein [Myxococcota bacterium]|nr:ATP-binding protein [Myxococcota bacterium]